MNNRTEYNEKLGEFYKCVSAPLAALAELNLKTLGELAQKNEIVETIAQAKTPEQIVNAQIKIAQTAARTGLTYVQQACEIWLDALSQTGDVINSNMRETNRKANAQKSESKL